MTTKYTQSGLWIEQSGDTYRIGLSEKGQYDVGDVMYVELPDFGEKIEIGDTLLSVEGAKAVTEIVAPVSGTVVGIHTELEDENELLNSTDFADNWILELADVEGLEADGFSDDPWFGQGKPEDTDE